MTPCFVLVAIMALLCDLTMTLWFNLIMTPAVDLIV